MLKSQLKSCFNCSGSKDQKIVTHLNLGKYMMCAVAELHVPTTADNYLNRNIKRKTMSTSADNLYNKCDCEQH